MRNFILVTIFFEEAIRSKEDSWYASTFDSIYIMCVSLVSHCLMCYIASGASKQKCWSLCYLSCKIWRLSRPLRIFTSCITCFQHWIYQRHTWYFKVYLQGIFFNIFINRLCFFASRIIFIFLWPFVLNLDMWLLFYKVCRFCFEWQGLSIWSTCIV